MGSSKWKRVVSVAAAAVAGVATAQDFADTQIGIVVTEAKLVEYGRGRVVGNFPAAVLSRDPVRRTKGYLVFDSDEQRFQRSQIPLQILFSRGEQTFDPASRDLKITKDATLTYSVTEEAMLGKLTSLLADNQVKLATNLVPTKPFDRLETFTETAPRLWYLRQTKEAGKKEFDVDVPLSVAIDLGQRKSIETLHEAWTKDPKAGALAIYQHHYVDQAISFQLHKLRPGQPATKLRGVSGVHLVRHRDGTAPGGRIVVPKGEEEAAWTTPLPKLELATNKVTIAADAGVVIKNLVVPTIRGDAKEEPKLECLVPDEENETSACRKQKDGGIHIEGNIGPEKPLVFIVEKIIEGAEPGAYRDMYRVEMHLGAAKVEGK